SALLKRLGEAEANTLSPGAPSRAFDSATLRLLPALEHSDLVKVWDERVRFSHELLGDWARLKVLVEQDPTVDLEATRKTASVRWHRAVRLFAQRLLEQDEQGPERWRQAVLRLAQS